MYAYLLYGLSVRSDFALPDFPPGVDGSDIAIHAGEFDLPHAFQGTTGNAVLVAHNTTYLRCGFGTFRVHGGREVSVMLSPGVDPSVLARFVSGIIFGILLHQRHEFVLHASAIAVGQQVVAFCGESGSGKSSLADALLVRGHVFFTDDILPVRFGNGTPVAYPGLPALKLWPDAVQATGGDPSAMPRVWPEVEKRLRTAGQGLAQPPLPLSRVYVLDHGDADAVTPIAGAEAAYHLARCRYCARLLQPADTAWHFHKTIALAGSVPCFGLARATALDRLSDLVDLVEGHLGHPTTQASAESGG